MSQQETSKTIYLDSAASASSSKFAVIDDFANPNSIHASGRDAFEALENAREELMTIIGAKRPSEVIFTSGATEANNMAILGIARAIYQKIPGKFPFDPGRKKVIVFALEHESTLNPAKALENEGFDVQVLESDRNGFAKIQKFMELCDDKTALAIVQHANTEIGSIQNVKQMAAIAHENGVYFHCDCVGTFGNINVDVQDLNVDSASFSGHKIGAPKGIGALYLKSGTPIVPIMYGGHQEAGRRAGTQSIALAIAFAQAAKFAIADIERRGDLFREIIKYLAQELENIDGVRFSVGFPENIMGYLWNITSLTFDKYNAKDLILQYGKHGIIVSGGPACSAESDQPSHVLKNIKVPDNVINNVIRLSFGKDTTKEQLEKFIDVTKKILS